MIKRIHVRYHLRADEEHREIAERVHAVHHRHCPVYRSLEGGIEMDTSLEIEAL